MSEQDRQTLTELELLFSKAELRRAFEMKYELKKGRDIPSDEIHELSLNNFAVRRALEMHRRGDATYTEALEAAVLALAKGNQSLMEELGRSRRVPDHFVFVGSE